MATGKNFAQMSTKKLNALLETASEEDAVAIKAILESRKRRVDFKTMGYKTVSNCSAITIEISNRGSMVRYRMEDATHVTDDWNSPVSEWTEIHFDKNGEPYFMAYGSKQYLNEFMRI